MAKAPMQKPLIKIPRIGTAKAIRFHTRGRGESLEFRMYVNQKEVSFDPDSLWMDRSWFCLVVRELDRLKVWHYRTTESEDGVIFDWSKGKVGAA